MEIFPLHSEIREYLLRRELLGKFQKQIGFLKNNLHHPSLEVELLEPKRMRIFSFRIDRQYRAIFIFRDRDTIEIIEVNNHYK